MSLSKRSSFSSQDPIEPPKKPSEVFKEAQASFSLLPYTDSQDLRDFLREHADAVRNYDMTDKNIKWLKHLRKFPSTIAVQWTRNWRERHSNPVNVEFSDSQKKETTGLFVSNIVLTTKIKKTIEENKELKRLIQHFEVYLIEPKSVTRNWAYGANRGTQKAQAKDQRRSQSKLQVHRSWVWQGLWVSLQGPRTR